MGILDNLSQYHVIFPHGSSHTFLGNIRLGYVLFIGGQRKPYLLSVWIPTVR